MEDLSQINENVQVGHTRFSIKRANYCNDLQI